MNIFTIIGGIISTFYMMVLIGHHLMLSLDDIATDYNRGYGFKRLLVVIIMGLVCTWFFSIWFQNPDVALGGAIGIGLGLILNVAKIIVSALRGDWSK